MTSIIQTSPLPQNIRRAAERMVLTEALIAETETALRKFRRTLANIRERYAKESDPNKKTVIARQAEKAYTSYQRIMTEIRNQAEEINGK